MDQTGIQDELDCDENDGLEIPVPEIDEEEDENILTVEEVTFVNGIETSHVIIPASTDPLRYFMALKKRVALSVLDLDNFFPIMIHFFPFFCASGFSSFLNISPLYLYNFT